MRIQIGRSRFRELIPIDGVKQLGAQPTHRVQVRSMASFSHNQIKTFKEVPCTSISIKC